MTDTNNARDGLTANREAIFDNLRDKIGVWSDRQTYFNAGWDAALAAPQPQGGALTEFDIRRISTALNYCIAEGNYDAARAVVARALPTAPLTDEVRAVLQAVHDHNERICGALTLRKIHTPDHVSHQAAKQDQKSWDGVANRIHALLAAPRQPGEMGAGVPISELVAEVEAEPGGKERLDAARARLRGHITAPAQQDEREAVGVLAPCPFCGGEHIKLVDLSGWEAWCEDCGACAGCTTNGDANTREQMVAAWNRRALESASQPGSGEAVAWITEGDFAGERYIDWYPDEIKDLPVGTRLFAGATK